MISMKFGLCISVKTNLTKNDGKNILITVLTEHDSLQYLNRFIFRMWWQGSTKELFSPTLLDLILQKRLFTFNFHLNCFFGALLEFTTRNDLGKRWNDINNSNGTS